MKILTSFRKPPIPNELGFDWCAYYEGWENSGYYGWGNTEQEAIIDLLASYPEEDPNEP